MFQCSLYGFQWFTHNLGDDTNFQAVATNTCALLKPAALPSQHGNRVSAFLRPLGRLQYPSMKASSCLWGWALWNLSINSPVSTLLLLEAVLVWNPSKSFWSSCTLLSKQCRWPKSWFLPCTESLCGWPLETHAHTQAGSPLSKYMWILQIFPTQSCPCP